MPQLAKAAIGSLLLFSNIHAFSSPGYAKARTFSFTTKLHLSSPNNNNDLTESQKLQEKASALRQEAEQLRLNLELKKIDDVTNDVRDFAKQTRDSMKGGNGGNNMDRKKLEQLQNRVVELVRGSSAIDKTEADKMLGSLASIPTPMTTTAPSAEKSSFTDEEIDAAMALIDSLPRAARETLAVTAGYFDYDEAKVNPSIFLSKLSTHPVSNMALRRVYAQSLVNDPNAKVIVVDESYSIEDIADALVEDLQDRIDMDRAMELFPRSVQDMDEGLLPGGKDADAVFKLLDSNTFMATEKPIKVNGGYLIRGVNKRSSSSELMDMLDAKIQDKIPQFTTKYQVNHVEITADPNSEEFIEDCILITSNTFPVRAPLALGNEVVMARLKEANEQAAALASGSVGVDGVSVDLSWFNELMLPLLGSLVVIQGLHELGHLTVAWANNIKVSAPIILPSKGLPYQSFQNRLKTSPKDYTALFDLAASGPITGLAISFVALLFGLQLTTTVDPSTAQLLPSLPVGFLCQSSLGGTLVDLILGGGDGILINQEAATQIPLHPIAIAGFIGMLINSLDLLPIGSSDGGRMSQALLGRVWHLTFSSAIFFLIFVATFVSDSQDIFLGYLFLSSFTQRDLEIPCRNEIDKVELPRVAVAVVSWVIVALVLVPLR
eukprot:scaffold57743_cov50-Cyclotella_meneghiniana.AAC.5